MVLKKIDERLVRLQRMVDSWNRNGSVPRIERDIALEELRRLYDEVLDYAPGATQSVDDEVDGEGDSSGEECDESVAEVVEERIEEETSLLTPAAEESFEVVVATTSHSDLGEAFDDAPPLLALPSRCYPHQRDPRVPQYREHHQMPHQGRCERS